MARWLVVILTVSFFGAYLMFLTSMSIWKNNSIDIRSQSSNAPITLVNYDQPPIIEPLPPIFSMASKTMNSAAPYEKSSTSLAPKTPVVSNAINVSWSGLYACYDYGETFAAAFLASREAFVGMKKYRSVLKSHRAAHASHYLTWERQAYKTLDFLDFFVEHLSAYERRLNFGKIGNSQLADKMKTDSAIALSERLDRYCSSHFTWKAAHLQGNPHSLISVIPYYGEGMGKGQAQSSLTTRKAYIEATYWSVRALTPNVVISVCTEQDAQFIEDLASNRFHPALIAAGAPEHVPVLTLLVFELQSPQSLPVGAVGFYVRTINKESAPSHGWRYTALPKHSESDVIRSWSDHMKAAQGSDGSNVWQHSDHILFTEADQIIHARYMKELLASLTALNFMAPHRGVPMPSTSDFADSEEMLSHIEKVRSNPTLDTRKKEEGFSRLIDVLDTNQKVKTIEEVQVYASESNEPISRCCMDAGNCSSREHWRPYLDPDVVLLKVKGESQHDRGLTLVGGEGNVQHNPPTIRMCKVLKNGQPCAR